MSTELAWAAGFFDGEGCVYVNTGNVYSEIPQVGREVLDRFAAAVGVGKVADKTRVPDNGVSRQPQHRWRVCNFAGISGLIAQLWPYLSAPKKKQMKAAWAKAYGRSRPFPV